MAAKRKATEQEQAIGQAAPPAQPAPEVKLPDVPELLTPEFVKDLSTKNLDFIVGKLKLCGKKRADLDAKVAEWDGERKEMGMWLFGLRCEHNRLIASGGLPQSKTFAQYHRDVTGFEINNHVSAMANMVRGFVESGHVSPQNYFDANDDAILTCSRIFTKAGDDTNHSAVKEAAAIFNKRKDGYVKELKKVLDRFDEFTTEENGKEVKKSRFLSKEEKEEQDKAKAQNVSPLDAAVICEDLTKKNQWGAMLAALLTWAEELTDKGQAEMLVRQLTKFTPALLKNHTETELKAWKEKEMGPKQVTEASLRREYFALRAEVSRIEGKYGEFVEKWVNEARELAGK